MALGRLSVKGSKLWGTYNPEGPAHWFKRKILDNLDKLGGLNIHFGLDDNPGLAPEVKERMRSAYSGHWKRRYIEGLWAGASGLIFPNWHRSTGKIPKKVKPVLSVDFGLAGVFVGLMFKDNTCIAEYYYDARDSHTRTEGEHADALVMFLKSHWAGFSQWH